MTISPVTETPLVQQRRPPSYFPGNDEDPTDAPSDPGAEFSFSDLLDVLNPLQHIPVVSTIYRAITGDSMSPTASVMGSAIFGGPLGALAAAATEMVSEMTGGSPEEHVLAMMGPDAEPAEAENLAKQEPAAPPSSVVPADARESLQASAAAPPDPDPSALFRALQSPGGGGAHGGLQREAPEKVGRDIRSYIAEAMPAAHPVAEIEQATPVDAPEGEREAMRAAVDAAHARGIEMLRQTQEAVGAPAPELPASFPEMMMRGLAKYRESSQLGGAVPAGPGTSG